MEDEKRLPAIFSAINLGNNLVNIRMVGLISWRAPVVGELLEIRITLEDAATLRDVLFVALAHR